MPQLTKHNGVHLAFNAAWEPLLARQLRHADGLFYTSLLLIMMIFFSSQAAAKSIQLTEGTNFSAVLAPDGEEFIIDLQGTLWRLPVSGGKAIALTNPLDDSRQPAWSPDGQHIVFQAYRDGFWQLWQLDRDGLNPQQLTKGRVDHRDPHWSPDGRWIVFSSDKAGNYDIWRIPAHGGEPIQLTTDAAADYAPAVASDGRVVFVSERESEGSNGKGLYILENGREQQVMASQLLLAAPAWGVDNDQLSVLAYDDAWASESTQLLLVNANNGNTTVISDPDEDVFPFRANWLSSDVLFYTAEGQIKFRDLKQHTVSSIPFSATVALTTTPYQRKDHRFADTSPRPVKGILAPQLAPNGQQVIFTALGDLWMAGRQGQLAQLTDDAFLEIDPVFSADGRRVVFSSDRSGSMDLWEMTLATGKHRQLTDDEGAESSPSWSADGKRVAFFRSGNLNRWGKATLAIMDLDSGKVIDYPERLFGPSRVSWSPDGKRLALAMLDSASDHFREGTSRIKIFDPENGKSVFLKGSNEQSISLRDRNGPVWSPDGNSLVYVSRGTLWLQPVTKQGNLQGQAQQLTQELASSPSWSGDSKTILYLANEQLKRLDLNTADSKKWPISLEWQPASATEKLIVRVGRLFDGESKHYRERVDILVEGNRIKEITDWGQHNFKGRLIDARDKTLLPGLFEMHAHQSSLSGERLGRIWLAFGITSVREPGAEPYEALERRESWQSGRRNGPRLFYTGNMIDGPRTYYAQANNIETEEQLKQELLRAKHLDYDLIKTYVRLPNEMQRLVTEYAHHELGIPVTSHELYPAAAFGVDGVEHLTGTSRRGYWPKQTVRNRSYSDVVTLLSQSGMTITPTAALQVGLETLFTQYPSLPALPQYNGLYTQHERDSYAHSYYGAPLDAQVSIRQAIKEIVAAGGRVVAGTDAPFLPYGLSLHAELQFVADGGLDNYHTLLTATAWAADAVGVGEQLGRIKPGWLADMVLVEGDPLKDLADLGKISAVIRDGHYLPQDVLFEAKISDNTMKNDAEKSVLN